MKRKITALLTLALTITFISGCGDDSESGTSVGSKHADTLSEYLSSEKTICYSLDEMDKEEEPNKIYFFDDGKLTIIPGEEFGLTMGELSQMKDKEIWKKCETVKESYQKNYSKKMKKSIEIRVTTPCDRDIKEYTEIVNALTKVRGKSIPEDSDTEIYSPGYIADFIIHWLDDSDAEAELRMQVEESLLTPGEHGTVYNFTPELVDGVVKYYQEQINELTTQKENADYKGPFYDIPFSFIVKTDSSGNNVQEEQLVYATLDDPITNKVTQFYDTLSFPVVEGTEREIYDSTYQCLGLSHGSIFCSRDSMILDSVDSDKVLVDPDNDKINKLFKKEVEARYR